MKKSLAMIALSFFASGLAHAADAKPAAVDSKEVVYEVNGAKFKGFLAVPANVKGKVPGILVVHEWWGHNAYARKRATMLAELGYAAFALDMYGEDKHTDDPKVAGEMMMATVKSGQMKARFDGALAVLKADPRVDADKLGAIGYCFGGMVVLSMARENEPLKAVVSFHGSFPPHADIKPGSVKAKIFVAHGGADQFAKPEDVKQFRADMDKGKVDYEFVVYPDAKHGFTDPEATKKGEMHHIPVGYNKSADEKSWAEMQKLFKKVF